MIYSAQAISGIVMQHTMHADNNEWEVPAELLELLKPESVIEVKGEGFNAGLYALTILPGIRAISQEKKQIFISKFAKYPMVADRVEECHGKIPGGSSLLSAGGFNQNLELIELVLSKGVDINEATLTHGGEIRRPLYSAFFNGGTIEPLIIAGADANAVYEDGNTLLHKIAEQGVLKRSDLITMQILIMAGANPYAENHLGESAMSLIKDSVNTRFLHNIYEFVNKDISHSEYELIARSVTSSTQPKNANFFMRDRYFEVKSKCESAGLLLPENEPSRSVRGHQSVAVNPATSTRGLD